MTFCLIKIFYELVWVNTKKKCDKNYFMMALKSTDKNWNTLWIVFIHYFSKTNNKIISFNTTNIRFLLLLYICSNYYIKREKKAKNLPETPKHKTTFVTFIILLITKQNRAMKIVFLFFHNVIQCDVSRVCLIVSFFAIILKFST